MRRRTFKYKTTEFKEARKEKFKQKKNQTPKEYLEFLLKKENIKFYTDYELAIRKGKEVYDYFLPDLRIVIQLNLLSKCRVKVAGCSQAHIRDVIVALNECKILRIDGDEIFDLDFLDILDQCNKVDNFGPVRKYVINK